MCKSPPRTRLLPVGQLSEDPKLTRKNALVERSSESENPGAKIHSEETAKTQEPKNRTARKTKSKWDREQK
jgi:hypothetical protein